MTKGVYIRREITKKRISETLKGHKGYWENRKFTKEHRKKIREGMKKAWKSDKKKNIMAGIKKWKIKYYTPKEIKRRSDLMKKRWRNKEYAERVIEATMRGLFKRPTSLEKEMIDIIKKHNLPYKYTGNGSFLIGYKNPDFVNTNGEKICIEVANTVELHHPKDYSITRKRYFSRFGWKCIIFMRNKLDEQEVLEEISKEVTT